MKTKRRSGKVSRKSSKSKSNKSKSNRSKKSSSKKRSSKKGKKVNQNKHSRYLN